MKRILTSILTLAFLFASSICFAGNVSSKEAIAVASKFFASGRGGEIVATSVPEMRIVRTSLDGTATKSASEAPTYYVVVPDSGRGFVIVSGDNACKPIIGYSFDSYFPEGELVENLSGWLEIIDSQIGRLRQLKVEGSEEVLLEWENATKASTVLELSTAKWSQTEPFNRLCPEYNGNRCVTGCVQTAVGIVMKYHEWPTRGTGSTSSYTTDSYEITVPGRNLDHSYNWSNMPMSYSSSFTDAQATEVATLMADLGSAFQADYGPYGTGSVVDVSVLVENFGYSISAAHACRDHYSESVWLSKLKTELTTNGPILYSGVSTSGGHQFILDGYDSSNYFHVNWGWGGYCDGYFTLDSLCPTGSDNYSSNQWAILNLKPSDGSVEEIENWLTFYNAGMSFATEKITSNTYFQMNCCFGNMNSVEFNGVWKLAVTDADGNIKENLTNEIYRSIPANAHTTYSGMQCIITNQIMPGDRIRGFYKADGFDWHLLTSEMEGTVWEKILMESEVEEDPIKDVTSFEFDKSAQVITLNTLEGISVTVKKANGSSVTSGISISGGTVTINVKNWSSGTYTIELSKGDDKKSFEFVIGSL